MDYEVGDIVKLKKQHPCGSKEWRILRVGADFRLECMGCSHQIMIPRNKWRKIPGGFARRSRSCERANERILRRARKSAFGEFVHLHMHIFGSQHFITPSSHSFTLKKKKR